ncbi:MAG: nucleotidyl transferase AbiEii/AbiGii toxin family protein, partial [Cyclobacteriaceae bacterium]
HRSRLTRINGMDYTRHAPKYINPIPPKNILKSWEADYKTMQEQMIYGESLPFKEMIERLLSLKAKINALDWEVELKK